MRIFFTFVCSCAIAFSAIGQKKEAKQPQPDSTKKTRIAEAACGECQFGLEGKSCDLAVRIDEKFYFVDGTDIDAHGDAHAKDGFCKTIRMAEVQGEVVGGRFKVSYFKLILNPAAKETKNKN